MKRIGMILSLALVMPIAAWAGDIVATWQHEGKTTLKIYMRGENRIRMNTSTDSYMLMSGEKVYMVAKDDGKWQYMDMDQMAAMMSRLGTHPAVTSQDADRYQSTFKKTGRTETVAGYIGSVYVAETMDESGKVIHSSDIVLSKHKDIERVSTAWQTFALRMGTIIGQNTSVAVDRASKEAKMSGYGGVLRIDNMKLISIEKPSLSAAYYELPKDAQPMEMGSAYPSGMQAEPAAASGAEEDATFAEELGKEAGDAAQDEVKENTIEEVRKGIGGLFKKVFE